jgi:hypothetical protein
MKKKTKKTIAWGVIAIAIIFTALFLNSKKQGSAPVANDKLDEFSQCLKDKDAVFYGAYWCLHCQNQKKLLGQSKNMPYVECSTPTGTGQTQICKDKKIEGYPTWIFANGSTQSGELTLDALAQQTGCQLPQ